MLRKNFLFCYLQRFNLFVGCWPKFGENIRKNWKANIRYYLKKNKNKPNKVICVESIRDLEKLQENRDFCWILYKVYNDSCRLTKI